MAGADPLTERGEAAGRLLHQTLGLYRTRTYLTLPEQGSRRLAAPSFDAVQVQRQATVLRMIAITEAYCVDRLLDLAEAQVEPDHNQVRASVWEDASRAAISNWKSIQKAFKDWHGTTADWKRFDGLLEIRNAIAHGLGLLTPLQRRKLASTRTLIGRTTFQLDGDRIVIQEPDVENTLRICIDLIAELDSSLPRPAQS